MIAQKDRGLITVTDLDSLQDFIVFVGSCAERSGFRQGSKPRKTNLVAQSPDKLDKSLISNRRENSQMEVTVCR